MNRNFAFDSIFYIACICACSGIAYGLYKVDAGLVPDTAQESEAIAWLERNSEGVKRRPPNLPAWLDVDQDKSLRQKEWVFTPENGFALIRYLDDSELTVGSNSMVVVEQTDDRAVAEVLRGFVMATLSNERSQLELNFKGKKAVIKSQKAQIQIDTSAKGDSKLRVLKGSASVVSDGKTISIKENEETTISSEGKTTAPKKTPIRLKMKEVNGRLESAPTVTSGSALTWESDGGDTEFVVDIARDHQFTRMVARKEVDSSNLPLAGLGLKGEYYWRVAARNGKDKGRVSATGKFRAVSSDPPAVIRPIGVFEGAIKDGKFVRVPFDWSKHEPGVKAEWQLSESAKFDRILVQHRLGVSHVSHEFKTVGEFYWRIRFDFGGNKFSNWSPPGAIRIVEEKEIEPPQFTNIRDGQTVVMQTAGQKIALAWNPVNAARSYTFYASNSQDFTQAMYQTSVASPGINWVPEKSGKVYLTVVANGLSRSHRSKGEWISLDLKPNDLALNGPANGKKYAYSKKGQAIRFEWTPVFGIKKYTLQIADNQQFTKPVFFETTASVYEWFTNQSGDWYWRVGYQPAKGREIWSEPLSFNVGAKKLLAPPSLKKEYELDLQED